MSPIPFLTASWWRTGFLALAVIAAVQTVRIEGLWPISGLKEQVATAQAQRDAERAAHVQTKLIYEKAQEQAARIEGKRLLAVMSEQQEITHEIGTEYAQRLAAARARHDELALRLRGQGQAGAGAAGAGGGEPLPQLAGPAGRADATPGPAGLSDPEMTLAERWRASQQALQLDALIDWVERQGKVPVNSSAQPASGAPAPL